MFLASLFTDVLSHAQALLLIALFFGGSIFVHELGHFLAARRRGLHIERFSIGFGPAIFAWRGRDGVEYRLSWLPLGGYVMLPQLADMQGIEGSSATDAKKLRAISYSDKMIVSVMGAVFNMLFAFALATILWGVGRPATEDMTTTTIGRVLPTMKIGDAPPQPSPAAAAGLRAGDQLVSVDGRPVADWLQFKHRLITGTRRTNDEKPAVDITVRRDGQLHEFHVLPVRIGEEKFRHIGVEGEFRVVVDEIAPDSPLAKLGFKKDDVFVSVGGKPARNSSTLFLALTDKESPPSEIVVQRGEAQVSLPVTPGESLGKQFDQGLTIPFRLLYQDPLDQCGYVVDMTVTTLGGLILPGGDIKVSDLSGFIGIGRGFWSAAKSDYPWRFGLWFAVMVNINLAIFNLLPIPVLDGGQMLFATIGKLRGRALPVGFVQGAQGIFAVLLFSLMAYVSFFDVRRWSRESAPASANESKPAPAPTPAKP